MKKVIFYLFILYHLPVFSTGVIPVQKVNIDSLKRASGFQTGTQQLKTLNKIFDYYLSNDLDSAEIIAHKMQTLSKESGQAEYLALSEKKMGLIYLNRSDYKRAEEALKQAIAIESQNNLPLNLAESYRILAGIYNHQGNLNDAADYLSKGLEIYQKQQNYEGEVMCLNNLGILYKQNRNFQKAIENYRKALDLIRQHKISSYDKSSLYTNLGIAFRYLQQYDSSYYYQRLALDESLKKKDLQTGVSNYHNLAKLFMELKQKDSVEYYLNKAIRLAESKFPDNLSALLSSQGKWYYKTGEYDKAAQVLKKALQLGYENHNMNDKEYALYYLYKTHQAMKKYPEAIQYLEDLVDVQDSIKMEDALVKINRLEEKYENEKKRIRIEQLEKIRKLDKRIKYLLGFIIFSILVAGGVVIYQLRQRQKRNQAEKQRIEEDLRLKTKQLTSQALMMMQKNTLLNDILQALSELKNINTATKKEITELKRKLKRSMHSEDDWELFKQYFEMVNKDFFDNLLKINDKLTSSELKLAALIKLKFNIKDSATLLNISPDSVKSARYTIRKKLGLKRGDNLYEFLSDL